MDNKKVNKKKNINITRLVIFVILIVIVVCLAIWGIKKIKSPGEEIVLDGSAENIDTSIPLSQQLEIEYDGNPYNVPQKYTESTKEYYGANGEELTEEAVSEAKKVIQSKFKSLNPEKIGLDVQMDQVSIIYTEGTVKIADSNCIVFAIYKNNDDKTLKYICKYAMNTDASVLYKFDSDTMLYNMIEDFE